MAKLFLIAGSISGALAVMIGAFGAHAWQEMLEASGRTRVFETGSKYHFYHSLALLAVGILLATKWDTRLLHFSGYAFILGIVLFSGSLYALCLTNAPKWGMITPVGGLFFIAGWLLLLAGCLKSA